MLHFNPQTGLYPDEVENVRAAVRADWQNAFKKDGLPPLNVEPETPAGQLIDSQTAAIVDKDNEVLFLAQQFNPETASGIWQDALGKIYFLTRKIRQPSVATCICTGLNGTTIEEGAIIKAKDNNTQWAALSTTTIGSSGNVTLQFQCLDSDTQGASANSLTEIVTVTPGWDAVTNPTPAIQGTTEENRIEFEKRRYASVAKNSRGSVYSLYGALADIEDVIEVCVLENTTNEPIEKWGVTIDPHSVYISIVGGTDKEIAKTIYEKKDAGCGTTGNTEVTYQDIDLPGQPIYTYKIQRPTPLNVNFKVTIQVTKETPENIIELIKKAIQKEFIGEGNHLSTRVTMGQMLYASRFYCSVIEIGVQNLIGIELSTGSITPDTVWTDAVTINADQAPTTSEANIQVILQEN